MKREVAKIAYTVDKISHMTSAIVLVAPAIAHTVAAMTHLAAAIAHTHPFKSSLTVSEKGEVFFKVIKPILELLKNTRLTFNH